MPAWRARPAGIRSHKRTADSTDEEGEEAMPSPPGKRTSEKAMRRKSRPIIGRNMGQEGGGVPVPSNRSTSP
uniref:Uncharacterized protein n=1 Tax=Sphaerodactylus townsendi TaxID=933632 RepID=A0ACB8FAX9_9SAUR